MNKLTTLAKKNIDQIIPCSRFGTLGQLEVYPVDFNDTSLKVHKASFLGVVVVNRTFTVEDEPTIVGYGVCIGFRKVGDFESVEVDCHALFFWNDDVLDNIGIERDSNICGLGVVDLVCNRHKVVIN